ncbi:MAG: extracellular solute-binding protein, partial [Gammaproteobacteria bacterium]|nr:extracellular solute-binding protein [Gammaproteobacteria bacterium]
ILVLLVQSMTVIADNDALVIYSGRSDKFVKPVIKAFTKKTGIKVILHSAKSTALLNKLRVEGDRTEADLFLSNDAGSLQAGAEQKLFQPLAEKLVSFIAPDLRAKDNTWVGLSARARVLVVNTNVKDVQDLGSVFDLATPRLKGRIAITNSTNGSFISGATVYLRAAGKQPVEQWLTGLKENAGGQVFNKHSKVVKEVASGKKAVGLINHYYFYRHLAKNPDAPIRLILPDQGKDGMGIAWNVAGIAVSKYSNKRTQAEKLIAFLVSEEGQQMFAETNREYPVRTGVSANSAIPPLNSYKIANVPMVDLYTYRAATIELIEKLGMP